MALHVCLYADILYLNTSLAASSSIISSERGGCQKERQGASLDRLSPLSIFVTSTKSGMCMSRENILSGMGMWIYIFMFLIFQAIET